MIVHQHLLKLLCFRTFTVGKQGSPHSSRATLWHVAVALAAVLCGGATIVSAGETSDRTVTQVKKCEALKDRSKVAECLRQKFPIGVEEREELRRRLQSLLPPEQKMVETFTVQGTVVYASAQLAADTIVFEPGSRLIFTREAINTSRNGWVVLAAHALVVKGSAEQRPLITWDRSDSTLSGTAGLHGPNIWIAVEKEIHGFVSVDASGPRGAPGVSGQPGRDGLLGRDGLDAQNGPFNCMHGPTSGERGGNGADGDPGGRGGAGGDGGAVIVMLPVSAAEGFSKAELQALIKVDGGPGGPGGEGGLGGAAGRGGRGGRGASPWCVGTASDGDPGSPGRTGVPGSQGPTGNEGFKYVAFGAEELWSIFRPPG